MKNKLQAVQLTLIIAVVIIIVGVTAIVYFTPQKEVKIVNLEKTLIQLEEKHLSVLHAININYENRKAFNNFMNIVWHKTRYNTLVTEEKILKEELEKVKVNIIATKDKIKNERLKK